MANHDPTLYQPPSAELTAGIEAEIPTAVSPSFTPEVIPAEEHANSKEKTWQWLRKNKLKIAVGSYAVSLAIGLFYNPNHIEERALKAAPVAGGVYLASEIAWAGGFALLLSGAGSEVGNPLTMRKRWERVKEGASDNRRIRSGLVVSGLGGLGIEAAIVAGAVAAEMPTESWAVLGPDVALGVGTTIWARKILLDRMKANRLNRAWHENAQSDVSEINTKHKIHIRKARPEDIERLAEIGKSRYKRSGDENEQSDEEAVEMFRKRLDNTTSQWMYVCEVDGEVEGSAIAFRTNKPWEEFVSWEDSTADGTLDGRVDTKGKYVYVVNLTVNPKATKLGGADMLMANLLAEGIKEGVEYGYFVSRMPLFAAWLRRWARKSGSDLSALSPEQLDQLAQEYADLKEVVDGKEVPADFELRMYEESGFEMGRLVKDAYADPMSLNYGVLFKAPVPPNNRLKKVAPVRYGMATALRAVAKHPKLLEKVI